MSLTKNQHTWLIKKMNKVRTVSGKSDLTGEEKGQIWKDFADKYGNIAVNIFNVPIGLLPGKPFC